MQMKRAHISVFTPCYNEQENVAELIEAVEKVFAKLPQYTYEHVFIDNRSTDNTAAILRKIAAQKKHVKVILNARNFGHIRSPYYGMLQCHGDAVITLVADFQDPPEMIASYLAKWEEGYKIVIGIKKKSKENGIMFMIRKAFYALLSKVSSGERPIQNFTGFGLYDQSFLNALRLLDDPYPYFRGMISEFGFDRYEIEYEQPLRKAGKTKNNFFTLYDMAILGFINHSKLPLRLSVFVGIISLLPKPHKRGLVFR